MKGPPGWVGRMAWCRNIEVGGGFSVRYDNKLNQYLFIKCACFGPTNRVLAIKEETVRIAFAQSAEVTDTLLLLPAFQSLLNVTWASVKNLFKGILRDKNILWKFVSIQKINPARWSYVNSAICSEQILTSNLSITINGSFQRINWISLN